MEKIMQLYELTIMNMQLYDTHKIFLNYHPQT